MDTTTDLTRQAPGPAPHPGAVTARRGGAPLWQWVMTSGAVAAVNAALSLDAVSPVQTKDEIGYLMAGRLLGGGGPAELIMPPYAGGYSAGWGLLVSPLWSVLGGDPVRFMHATVAVNVALATLAVLAWTAVSRRLGAGPRASLVVGGLVAVAPGRALYTGYALPEALLGVLVAVAFLLVLRLWGAPRRRLAGDDGRPDPTRAGTAWLLAGLVSYLSLVHSRFLPTVAVLLVVLAWWAWSGGRLRRWFPAAAGAAGALAGVLANRWVEDQLYGDVDRFSAAGEQIGQLHAGFMTSLVLGHAWYGAVAWGGFTVVGVLWALGPALAEVRRRSPGPFLVLLAVVAAQLMVGAFYLSTRITVGAGRLDQLVYGRYMDPVWALLAVVGLTVLVTGRLTPALLRRAVVVVALLGVAVGVVLLALGGIVGGLVQLNVPGIEMWRWSYGDGADGSEVLRVPFVQATLAALAVLVGVRAAQRRWSPRRAVSTVLVGLACLALTGTLVAEVRTIAPRDERLRDLFTLRETVEDNPAAPVVLVVDRPLLLSGTAFQFWLGDRDYRVLDPAVEAVKIRPGELVVGTLFPRPLMIGAPVTLVEVDPTARYGVWLAEGRPEPAGTYDAAGPYG